MAEFGAFTAGQVGRNIIRESEFSRDVSLRRRQVGVQERQVGVSEEQVDINKLTAEAQARRSDSLTESELRAEALKTIERTEILGATMQNAFEDTQGDIEGARQTKIMAQQLDAFMERSGENQRLQDAKQLLNISDDGVKLGIQARQKQLRDADQLAKAQATRVAGAGGAFMAPGGEVTQVPGAPLQAAQAGVVEQVSDISQRFAQDPNSISDSEAIILAANQGGTSPGGAAVALANIRSVRTQPTEGGAIPPPAAAPARPVTQPRTPGALGGFEPGAAPDLGLFGAPTPSGAPPSAATQAVLERQGLALAADTDVSTADLSSVGDDELIKNLQANIAQGISTDQIISDLKAAQSLSKERRSRLLQQLGISIPSDPAFAQFGG